jgi:hypothetical protein
LYFSPPYTSDLQLALAENAGSSLDRIAVWASETPDPDSFQEGLWREVSRSGIVVRSIYLISHLGLVRGELSRQLREDRLAGIDARIATAGSIPEDLAQLSLADTILVGDDVVARSADSVGRMESAGDWTVTNAENHIAEGRRLFEQLWLESQPYDQVPTALDLEEPLVQSAPVIAGVAPVLCQGDHVDPAGCAWYHGTWQYLRLMNLVSTPSWHHDFYMRSIAAELKRGARDILISGTADYSVFAYIVSCLGDLAGDTRITVVDLCNTPLFACQWYAKRVGIHATMVSEDVRSLSKRHSQSYDLIVTDAFLTRFGSDEAGDVVQQWKALLRGQGSVITTVRAHEETQRGQTTEEAIASFRERATVRWKRWQPFIHIDRTTIAAHAEAYARRMVSHPIGGSADILSFIEASLLIDYHELAEVPGELYPTRYLRLNLRLD